MLNSKLIKVISHLSLNELDNLTLKLQHAETNVAKLFNYILPFSAALKKDNFYAGQFHPEKSADIGQQIIQNFIALC